MMADTKGPPAGRATPGSRDAQRFNARALLALTAALSGVALPVTGIADHAHRSHGAAIGAAAWTSAHVALGVLFTVAVTWHAALNRRALRAYLRGTTAAPASITREAVCAVAVVSAVVLAAVGHALLGN